MDFVLFVGSWSSKNNLPQVSIQFNSDSSRNIHAIQTEDTKHKTLGNQSVIFRRQLSSARQPSNFDTLNMDMMKTVDGGVHECDESDDVARGVLGRLENMSSLNKLLLPGTPTFCPIKLRLADGDSSSMITHRTLPLQLHIGIDMLKQLVSMSLVSVTGLFLGTLGWRDTIPKSIGKSRMVDLDPTIVWENCCVGSTRIQGLGKPPSTSDISPKPCIPEQESSDQTSYLLPWIRILMQVYSKTSIWISISVLNDQYLQNTSNTSKSVSFAETIQTEAEILPAHRSFDCTINLSSSAEPSYGRIYQLTREEDKVMQEWISDNLAKGFIRNSSSPYGAPCFFVKQKDKLRLCMDYRGLNKQTIKDRNPIPLISEMLRTLSTGKIFTTLDLRGAYNLLRIKEGDEPKTAFITKYGQFEFLVMPFGLANAPAQFNE
ncbi:hypothetical protein BASA83_013570 [Batrachochytrium salamandrivorans]|nr:hypothetical protein BASA83_013570 [Batrachochytrium salamandrivorans]